MSRGLAAAGLLLASFIVGPQVAAASATNAAPNDSAEWEIAIEGRVGNAEYRVYSREAARDRFCHSFVVRSSSESRSWSDLLDLGDRVCVAEPDLAYPRLPVELAAAPLRRGGVQFVTGRAAGKVRAVRATDARGRRLRVQRSEVGDFVVLPTSGSGRAKNLVLRDDAGATTPCEIKWVALVPTALCAAPETRSR